MDNFNELRRRYPAIYEFEYSKHRILISLIDVEAFGYDMACIITGAMVNGQVLENIELREADILDMYGIDSYSIEESLERAQDMNLLTYEKSGTIYKLSISTEMVRELRETVAKRRIYPTLDKRYQADKGTEWSICP